MKSYINALVVRYSLLLVILAAYFVHVLLAVFQVLTLGVVGALLKAVGSVQVTGNVLFFHGVYFQFVAACIAPEAYLLLAALLLTVHHRSFVQAGKLLGIAWGMFFLGNIARIMVLVWIRIAFGAELFHAADWLVWNFMSVGFIVLLWLFLRTRYDLIGIPVVQDMFTLLKLIRD